MKKGIRFPQYFSFFPFFFFSPIFFFGVGEERPWPIPAPWFPTPALETSITSNGGKSAPHLQNLFCFSTSLKLFKRWLKISTLSISTACTSLALLSSLVPLGVRVLNSTSPWARAENKHMQNSKWAGLKFGQDLPVTTIFWALHEMRCRSAIDLKERSSPVVNACTPVCRICRSGHQP